MQGEFGLRKAHAGDLTVPSSQLSHLSPLSTPNAPRRPGQLGRTLPGQAQDVVLSL